MSMIDDSHRHPPRTGGELLRLVHGSHLYGTAHAGSDLDLYVVVAGSHRPVQTIRDGIDVMVLGLPQFLAQASAGVPQALEAMFAPQPELDLIGHLRRAFRVAGGELLDRMRRTVRAFAGDPRNPLKRRRHALRIAYGLGDVKVRGRYCPVLTGDRLSAVLSVVDSTSREELRALIDLAAGEDVLGLDRHA